MIRRFNDVFCLSLFFLMQITGPAAAQRILIQDALKDSAALGTITGSGEFMSDGGWRSTGGKIVFDAGHVITNGYFEATMRGWTAPAQGSEKNHPLAGWEFENQYARLTQQGSYFNWRIGSRYGSDPANPEPYKILAKPCPEAERPEARLGSRDQVNDGNPHRYRAEWNNGRVTFWFDSTKLISWEFPFFRQRFFTIGRDDNPGYDITSPPPVISDIVIVDRDLYPLIPVRIVSESLPAAVYAKWYSDTVTVQGGRAPFLFRILSGAFPQGIELDTLSGVVSGVPAASGRYQCRIAVCDSNTPVQTDTSDVLLDVVNHVPVFLSRDAVRAEENSMLTYVPQTADQDGNDLLLSVLYLPSWLSWDETAITGIVPAGTADTTFSLAVTDGELTDSLTVTVCIDEDQTSAGPAGSFGPETFVLYQNHPNPFNSGTIISYDVELPSLIQLDIYNICGVLVKRLVDTRMNPGHYRHRWDGNGESGGVYVVRLRRGHTTRQIKMLLMK